MTDEEKKLFDSLYKNGDEMPLEDHSCCCELYYVGDRRCSCGCRRIQIVCSYFEGKPFFYPEAY